MKLLGERNVDIVARFMHDTVNMNHVIFDVVDDDITLRRGVSTASNRRCTSHSRCR